MFVQWHIVMPLLVRLLGYVPAKRLGWMEDTLKGVAMDWARIGPRFETSLSRGEKRLAERFQRVRAPIFALGIEDAPFGTVPAIDRLLNYYTGSDRHHLRLAPSAIGQDAIGHFAFFHKRFRESLWPIAWDWLFAQKLPSQLPGSLTQTPSSSA